jgi:tetratricopeptide (TPR) repeat protein
MSRRRWQARVGVLAVAFGMAAAGPVEGAPTGKAPAAASKEVAEAERLGAEVERLYGQGRYDEALPLAERALAIRERTLGPDHPDIAQFLNYLAVLRWAGGDYARAEPLYQRALAIREKALGPDHPDVADVLNNLAMLQAARGHLPEAVTAARRAADIQDRNAAALLATGAEEPRSAKVGLPVGRRM